MKKIFRNLKFGLMLCAGMFAASCSEVDGTMDEIPYTRVLTPLNFDADVVASAGTDVRFTWSTVSNAESYILEVFEAVVSYDTDENGKEVEIVSAPDYDNTLPAYTVELTNDEIPYTMKDLEVDKSFYARVRAVSSRIESSHWSYLTDYVTTSAVRASLNPFVIERTASTVTIGWDAAEDKEDLTSVRYEPVVAVEGVTPVVMALSESEKNACKVLVENLPACVNYKFTLLFGKSGSRGVVTAWTRPDTEGTTRIESAEALYNALTGASAGEVKLLLAYNDGAVYDLTPYHAIVNDAYDPIELTCSISLYGEATAKGEKPVLRTAFKTASSESAVHIEDIVLDGGKVHGATVTTGGPMTAAEFVNCEYADYTKGIWSGAANCHVENLSFDGVYAHDINATGTVGGDFIDIRGGNYGKIAIKNSTFYACARTFLRFSDTEMSVNDINVENCTFNQVTATAGSSNNAGIFHVRHLSGTTVQATVNGTFTMTKCVFLNEGSETETESAYWVRLTRQSAENYAPICAGNIFYNVGHDYASIVSADCRSTFFYNLKSLDTNGEAMTEALALADGGMILDEDPCTNSIAGKMYLTNGVIAANKAGDPRWWNASEPIVVRATELETVTEPTVWDFTEKTKFQTETIEANTIIENIRIYAPAEIVMNEGITFAAAAAVNASGVPQNNALQFRASGVGAVEVTTLDGGVNSSVQVVVGTDRYVLLADGETHKVVLGDLVGENDIYVLAGSAVTITSVAWTDDLTPENTVETLATPNVAFDISGVDEGTAQDITASWSAIENAASYEVTFNGKKSETAETTFTVDAATVASLAVGEYEISVVAKPVSTSTKYAASEAATASFKIRKVILAGFATVTWDFLSFDGSDLYDAATNAPASWTNNTAFGSDVVWTVNAACPLTIMNGVTVQAAGSTNGAKMADGSSFVGGSIPTRRALYFTAAAPGTLKVTHKTASTGNARSLFVAINKDNAATNTLVYSGAPITDQTTDEIDLMDLTGGETVYIFTMGNNISKVEWTYVDENAGPVTTEYNWDFRNYSHESTAALTEDATYEVEGRVLTIKNGVTVESNKRIKTGGKTSLGADGIPTNRAFAFTAEGPGMLTYEQGSASSSGTGRYSYVSIDGVQVYKSVSDAPTSGYGVVEVDLSDVEAGQTVYIWVDAAINFQSVKWVETK